MQTDALVDFFVLSCEHAGYEIPNEVKDKIYISEMVRSSHRGWDKGAKELALKIQKKSQVPLYSFDICRLVIEGNRPLADSGLFSQYTKNLSEITKKKLIKIHQLHWEKVKKTVLKKIAAKGYCLHLGVHTFTPVLRGEMRTCDIGILYDPKNKDEKLFAQIALKELRALGFVVKMNYPYKGVEPGMTQTFRTELKGYAGIELEINQKIARRSNADKKFDLITEKLLMILDKFQRIKNG